MRLPDGRRALEFSVAVPFGVKGVLRLFFRLVKRGLSLGLWNGRSPCPGPDPLYEGKTWTIAIATAAPMAVLITFISSLVSQP